MWHTFTNRLTTRYVMYLRSYLKLSNISVVFTVQQTGYFMTSCKKNSQNE